MRISVLFTAGLCVLTHFAVAHELCLDDPVSQEEKVQIAHLSNGVKTYIQENVLPTDSCSLRVVIRKPSGGEERFFFDGAVSSSEKLEGFLALCKKKILNESVCDSFTGENAFCTDPSLFHMDHPQEIAIVAVGDFAVPNMQGIIEKHFGDIVFNEETPAAIQIGQDEKISKVILRLFYPNAQKPIATYSDLKESWKSLFLQELFQNRMELCSRSVEETWVHPHPRFFYPVNGYAFVSEEAMENLLSFFLWQAEAARCDGFFEDEFYVIKHKLLDKLQYLSLNAVQPDNAFLASYYADQFLLGDQCYRCEDFLSASASFIEEFQLEDLVSALDAFFQDRQIRMMYPQAKRNQLMTMIHVEELIDRVASLATFYRTSEIEEDSVWLSEQDDVQPVANKEKGERGFEFAKNVQSNDRLPFLFASGGGPVEPFYGLPLSDKEKRFIKSIINTMADKNLIQLVFEKNVLEKKGKRINHVHPLRFMGYILSHADLKNDVRVIKKSSFKWDAFVDGFAKRMKEELAHGNVYQHLPGFAQEIGTTTKHVEEYVNKKDFEGLIRSML